MGNFLVALLVTIGSFAIGLIMGIEINDSLIRKHCEKIGAFTIEQDVFSCEKEKESP